MVNINNKNWNKVRFSDIKKMLTGGLEENHFFEFKSDDITPQKLIKEVSAFANTYGGYIFLGINDDKTIVGCKKWTEQRIHTTIHDCITPTPVFDVKRFVCCNMIVFVIKIEEGVIPPYVTNQGGIFERLSSGSFPIKESYKLTQLYNKSNEQFRKISNKIELPNIEMREPTPNNLCAYFDLGFSVECSEETNFQKNFFEFDFHKISEYLKTKGLKYTISRVGTSYVISVGELSISDNQGNHLLVWSGLQNFIEIMMDGSIKSRIILNCNPNDSKADIAPLMHMNFIFREIYEMIFEEKFNDFFVHAHKYEKLTVLKQFVPFYNLPDDRLNLLQIKHEENYGGNLIINSNRYPKSDYILIDRRSFDLTNTKYNAKNIFKMLFSSLFFNLGFIDLP